MWQLSGTPTEKRIYLDGQLVARGADPLPRLETAYTDIGEVPTIGRATLLHNSLERFFKGRISEIRISESAKYADDFTPQQNLSKDDDALILYHFDEGSGSILNDHSGNNHHGTIHGATWVNADGSPIEQTEDPLSHRSRSRRMGPLDAGKEQPSDRGLSGKWSPTSSQARRSASCRTVLDFLSQNLRDKP